MKLVLIGVITAFVSMTAAVSVQAAPTLPDTPAGRRAAAYISAFNSGDDAVMSAFESEHRAVSALRRRSIEDRVVQYRKLFHDVGTVQLAQVIDAGPPGLLAVVTTKKGELFDWSFEIETDPPYKLLGVRISGPFDPAKGSAGQESVNETIKETVIDRIAKELIRAYTFEDVAEKMAKDIRSRLSKGQYSDIDNAYRFAQQLTTDLQETCHDLHLRVQPRRPRRRGDGSGFLGRRMPNNHGFIKVEVLPGNIGYIKLNGFSGDPAGQAPAAAAMAFVANTDALIFDLRENGGGSPEMICFISGYLFDKPVHLNTFDDRLQGISHTYSNEEVPGQRYGKDKPVYVLTSSRTFSAAEEFTYNLKHLKRATIVGEASGGGAHPVTGYTINKYFEMSVPHARAVNPVTKTNWEGVGVIPHVKVPADQALDTAHQLALESSDQAQ